MEDTKQGRRERMRAHLTVMARVPAVRKRANELIEYWSEMNSEFNAMKFDYENLERDLRTAKHEYEEIRMLNAGYQTQKMEWDRKERDYRTTIKAFHDLFFQFTLFRKERREYE